MGRLTKGCTFQNSAGRWKDLHWVYMGASECLLFPQNLTLVVEQRMSEIGTERQLPILAESSPS